MQQASIQSIVQSLNQANVRYLIAGGLAVVAHGYMRLTMDVDLILDLEKSNAEKALQALARLGYRPRAPVPLDQFADSEIREKWINDKGMTVFSLHSPQHEMTQIDLFVRSPINFETAWKTAYEAEIAQGVHAKFLNVRDLITTKQLAGRPQDVADIAELRRLHGE